MARSESLVRAFARILPREFRERVFEPAWADTLLEGSARWVLVLECLRLGLPQYVWHHGRPTRLARTGVTAMLVVATVVMLLMRAVYNARAY